MTRFHFFAKAIVIAMLLCFVGSGSAQAQANLSGEEAALAVINKFMGSNAITVKVVLDLQADSKGRDKFSYDYDGSALTVHGSSPVAACRGFYDFVKSNGAGINSWSGNRFRLPETLTKTKQSVFTSPFRDHQYFNVVTYGYTTPYWDEARWDQEIDWMALHGVDMPLMLVAAEAIYRKIFTEQFGLTSKEVDEWEVGPAHLPWFRMGNLAGNSFDGPLGDHWNQRQIALAKHILKRMRELGMKPVCPAFGGFVPRTFTNHNSGTTQSTGWNWVSGNYRNYRLNPGSAAFVKVGTAFIKEWEKTFGECQYYLSDSFNEMAVPNDLNTLTQYGDSIYKCIKQGSTHPKSVWVTQGWTFVYQSGEWGKDKFNALTKNVDRGRFIMLYMSPEYGNGKWNSPYQGFNNHEWNLTMLPNMGGKNFYNGGLNNYAGSYRTQLTGDNVSNLIGWGMTPEGVENNEMLYELICDAGWTPTTTTINVANWMVQYGKARYEVLTDAEKAFQTMLHSTVLASYQDHKCFGWQGYNKTTGYINSSIDPGDTFYNGIEAFFSPENVEAMKLQCSPLLRTDLVEAAAFYAGCKVEKLNKRIKAVLAQGDKEKARALVDTLSDVMLRMDRALTAHPLYDEQKWEDKAARIADANEAGGVAEADAATRARYIKNARRIVSVWYGDHGTSANAHEPVNDYACRTWAGLIRDYYLPRLVAEWGNQIDNRGNNLRTIENNFINAASLSPVESMEQASDAELLDYLVELIQVSKSAGDFQIQKETVIKASNDAENHWYAIRNAEPNFITRVVTLTSADPAASLTGTANANDYTGSVNQYWRFINNGDGTYRIENRSGQSITYDKETGKPATCMANVNTDMKMVLTTDASKVSATTADSWGILPVAISATNTNTGLHVNSGQGLMVWNFEVSGKYYPATCWTIEEVDKIDETYAEDYARMHNRLSGFAADAWGDASLYGKVGQPKSAAALSKAINDLGNYTAGDHETYNEFLEKWAAIWSETFTLPSSTQAKKLFDLIVSAMQLGLSPVNEDGNADLRAALLTAQQLLADPACTEAKCRTQITSLQKAIQTFITNYNISSGPIQNTTWVYDSWKVATANEVSSFLEAANIDINGVVVSGTSATVTVEMKYASGTHRQDTYGVELIDADGNVAYSDYHTGNTGGVHVNNTYTLSGVKAGTYTARCWSAGRANNQDINSTGAITVKVNGTTKKTQKWTKQDWMIDNSLLTNATLRAMYNKVGGEYYKYMDHSVKVVESEVKATYQYVAGSERIDIIGIEVLDASGKVVAADGHFGFTGSDNYNNTYTVTIPQDGLYTIRTWANYVREISANSRGNITYEVNDDPTKANAVTVVINKAPSYVDLNGQPVAAPVKGQIYISNGRKVRY